MSIRANRSEIRPFKRKNAQFIKENKIIRITLKSIYIYTYNTYVREIYSL